jgi:hypothetical protein
MTHYGWNSTMEAITAELPVVMWPHFMDQFLNQKMAVEVLCIGVSVGITELLLYQKVEKEIVVGRNVVEEAVRSVMGGGPARWQSGPEWPCRRAGCRTATCWIWSGASRCHDRDHQRRVKQQSVVKLYCREGTIGYV